MKTIFQFNTIRIRDEWGYLEFDSGDNLKAQPTFTHSLYSITILSKFFTLCCCLVCLFVFEFEKLKSNEPFFSRNDDDIFHVLPSIFGCFSLGWSIILIISTLLIYSHSIREIFIVYMTIWWRCSIVNSRSSDDLFRDSRAQLDIELILNWLNLLLFFKLISDQRNWTIGVRVSIDVKYIFFAIFDTFLFLNRRCRRHWRLSEWKILEEVSWMWNFISSSSLLLMFVRVHSWMKSMSFEYESKWRNFNEFSIWKFLSNWKRILIWISMDEERKKSLGERWRGE